LWEGTVEEAEDSLGELICPECKCDDVIEIEDDEDDML
jgi:hypothetical protein